MKRFLRVLKTVGVVAAGGAAERVIAGQNISTPEDLARTAAAGALVGIAYWLRSPNTTDRPPRQDPPKF